MKISKMANSIHPSLTRKLFDMSKQYDDVIDFTLGDPDYQTPEYVKKAGCDAIMQGKTKYSANAGLPELRRIVSQRIEKEDGVKYDPDSEIQITVGAMEGIFMTLCCLVDPGDEVIIPAPFWVNYKHMTQMLGGKPVIVDSDEEHDFVITAESLLEAVTDKTVAMIINSPNNPSGTVFDRQTLEKICEIAKQKNIVIIWDECYKSLVFDNAQFCSVLAFEGMKDHTVVVNSCSKRYSMTGWRVGYLAGPAELICNMPKLQENIAACVSLPSQYAAIAALGGDDTASEEMKRGFEKRRDTLVENINKINKLSCKMPKGTFYALVNIKQTGMSSEQFAYALLEHAHVAVVPGITYGDACEGYVRMAYTMNEDKIIDGVNRIKSFVDSL